MAKVILRRADGDSVLEERRRNGYEGFVSLGSPAYGKTATPKVQPAIMQKPPMPGARPAPISGPRDEKYVLADGKYHLNPNYDPPFDITLGQAIAIPPLIGAAGALLPEALVVTGNMLRTARAAKGSGLPDKAAKYIGQGFSPRQAKELARPYTGRGHHFVPEKRPVTLVKGFPPLKGLPKAVSNSRFNVLKPKGMTKGDFYELHYKVDPNFRSARIVGGGPVWVGRHIGLEKYDKAGRLWHGSPAPLKAAAGGAAGSAVAGGAYAYLKDDE